MDVDISVLLIVVPRCAYYGMIKWTTGLLGGIGKRAQQSSKLRMIFLSTGCSRYYRVARRGHLFQTNGACPFDLDVRPYDSLP